MVSVIIPTFNYGNLIEYAIKSVLNQKHGNLELIVIDDCSTDNTQSVVGQFLPDGRVSYVRLSDNAGPSAAKNAGLQRARGEYVQLLDADDLLASDKIDRQMAVLAKRPEASGTYCACEYFSSENDRTWIYPAYKPHDPYGRMLRSNFIPTPAMLFRNYGLTFDTRLRYMEDWEYWLRLCHLNPILVPVNHVLAKVRIHSGSLSRDSTRMAAGRVKVLLKHRRLDKRASRFLLLARVNLCFVWARVFCQRRCPNSIARLVEKSRQFAGRILKLILGR